MSRLNLLDNFPPGDKRRELISISEVGDNCEVIERPLISDLGIVEIWFSGVRVHRGRLKRYHDWRKLYKELYSVDPEPGVYVIWRMTGHILPPPDFEAK